MEGVELLQPLFACSGSKDVVSLVLQPELNGTTDVWVVFDNEDSWHFGSVGSPRSSAYSRKSPSPQPLQGSHRHAASTHPPSRPKEPFVIGP